MPKKSKKLQDDEVVNNIPEEDNWDEDIELEFEVEIEEIEDVVETSDEFVEEDIEIDSEEEEGDDTEEEIVEPVKKKNKFNNHRLKYDSIFKGKKHDVNADEFSQDFLVAKQNSFELIDHYNSEDHYRIGQLEEIIYQFVLEKTTIDMSASRRKPGRNEFNKYIQMLTDYVDLTLYTHAEIFCVFATYFSDNLFSMFRLLDKKWGAVVAKELKFSHNDKDFDSLEIV